MPSALLGSACNVDGVQEMPTVMWELARQVHLHYMAAKPQLAFAQLTRMQSGCAIPPHKASVHYGDLIATVQVDAMPFGI